MAHSPISSYQSSHNTFLTDHTEQSLEISLGLVTAVTWPERRSTPPGPATSAAPTNRNKALPCKFMTRTGKWARERWENNLRGKLRSSQVDPKQWWSLVKLRQETATQESISPLKTAAGDLAVTNQAKADLLAEHFSGKMTKGT